MELRPPDHTVANVNQTYYQSLENKTILITGGASGIGADLVAAFSHNRCKVIFLDVQDEPGEALATSLGEHTHYEHCDLTNIDSIKTSVTKLIDKHGPISVLVNNAANDDRCNIEDITPDYWDWSQNINLRSQVFTAQAVLASMKSLNKGAIINLSSIAWRLGISDLLAYSTAKSGIHGLTRALARELGEYNIRVNTVEPGAIMTDKQKALWYPTEKEVQAMVDRQMMKQALTGKDVARVVLFLASDDSFGITGQSLRVDAGFQ